MDNSILIVIGIFISCAYLCYAFIFHWLYPTQNKLHCRDQTKAKKILEKIQQTDYSASYIFWMLRKMNPFVFEELLLLCFEQRGFNVIRNKKHMQFFGADGAFYDNHGNHIVIQAKRYKSEINLIHIIEFANTIKKFKATAGLFIHTGQTGLISYNLTPAMKIISGNKLLELLQVKKIEKTDWQREEEAA